MLYESVVVLIVESKLAQQFFFGRVVFDNFSFEAAIESDFPLIIYLNWLIVLDVEGVDDFFDLDFFFSLGYELAEHECFIFFQSWP